MLDRRRDLREREGEEFEAVQALSKEIRALPKEAREQVNRQRTAALEDEIGEAWPNRHFAQLHSLRIEYARNGRGPKNGFYFSPRATGDREDWIREMAKPALEGVCGVLGIGLGRELRELRETMQ